MAADLLTPAVQAFIGQEWPAVTYEVERAGIRMWARAVGFNDPVYYDEEVARSQGFDRLPAPPGYLGTPRWRPGESEAGPPIRGLHQDLQRSLNGGTEVEIRAPILAGDDLRATTRINDIAQRTGSVGPMLIISRQTEFRRGAEHVATLRATVINY